MFWRSRTHVPQWVTGEWWLVEPILPCYGWEYNFLWSFVTLITISSWGPPGDESLFYTIKEASGFHTLPLINNLITLPLSFCRASMSLSNSHPVSESLYLLFSFLFSKEWYTALNSAFCPLLSQVYHWWKFLKLHCYYMPWTMHYFYQHRWGSHWYLACEWAMSKVLSQSLLSETLLVPFVIDSIHHESNSKTEICIQGLHWELLLESTPVGKKEAKSCREKSWTASQSKQRL